MAPSFSFADGQVSLAKIYARHLASCILHPESDTLHPIPHFALISTPGSV